MTQNNNNQKPSATAAVPQDEQSWTLTLPFEGGGTISFTGRTNADVLAAHKGMRAVIEATCCTECQSHNTTLLQRQMNGKNGDYTQFFMTCNDCGAGYSFTTQLDHDCLLVESFNEEYRGWRKTNQSNDNNNGNNRSYGGNSQPSRSNQASNGRSGRKQSTPQPNQSRNQQPRRSQPPQQAQDEYDNAGYADPDDTIPF